MFFSCEDRQNWTALGTQWWHSDWFSSLTCGDVNVCDIRGAVQSQEEAAVAQDVPEVVQRGDIGNVQLHAHCVLKLGLQICRFNMTKNILSL